MSANNRSNRSASANKSSSRNGNKRTSTKKRTTSRKRTTNKRKSKKVFIPADKIILFCGCVVMVCAILLILTQAIDSRKSAEIKNEFEKITKVEKEDKAASANTNENIAMAKKPDNKVASRTSATAKDNNEGLTRSAAAKDKKEVEPEVIEPRRSIKTTEDKTSITSEFSFITPAKNNAVLVFVFDDGGQNLSQLEKVLALPFPITVAVLPGLIHSKDSAAKIRQSGNELILHQPMQAVNLNVNPGPGAITPSMNEEEIRSVLFRNIYEIGPIKGVNNHEGSLITADAEKMSYVMKFLSDEGLYFLDSRTNADTQVPFVAKSLGYSYYERNVFLDNTKVRADILAEIKKGLDYANKTGCAIMIGHVWSSEILPGILQEIYPVLVKNGYKFSTVSNCPARIN